MVATGSLGRGGGWEGLESIILANFYPRGVAVKYDRYIKTLESLAV